MAATYCNMANEALGLCGKVLEFHQKDLDFTVNIFGQDSPDVAKTHMGLGASSVRRSEITKRTFSSREG